MNKKSSGFGIGGKGLLSDFLYEWRGKQWMLKNWKK